MSCFAGPSKPWLLSSACQSVQHTDPRAPLRSPPPVEGDRRSVTGWALGGESAMASAAARLLRAYAARVEALRRLRNGNSQTVASGDRTVAAMASAAARLLRAYAAQVEALRRLRNGNSQTVRVEHVHVNEGGQAIIGNVNPILDRAHRPLPDHGPPARTVTHD